VPLYYFDFRDEQDQFIPDDTGMVLPDLKAAMVEASNALSEHAAEVFPGTESQDAAVRIRQEAIVRCEIVITFKFSVAQAD
jgi:hypothetical protein